MNSLSTQTSSHASQSKNIGAVTLRNSLLSDTKDISRVQLLKEMEFWIDAIKGEECQDERSTNIKNWYEKENALYSYAMPNWGVPPEHTALFREFREDPYYHLKNLVEVVGRTLVEEMLNAEWLGTRVYITSDSDDVFGGVDFIAEMRNRKGELEHIGLDLAISDNPEYLKQKEFRTETLCSEFNARKKLKGKRIPRQVFAIPPKIMARVLPKYMEMVGRWHTPNSGEVLAILEEAKTETPQRVQAYTKNRINSILH